MLLELGIKTEYRCVENSSGNLIHILNVVGKNSVKKFHSRIGFFIDYKSEWLEELVNVGNSTNKGIKLPYIQSQIVDMADAAGITTYSNPSLGRTVKLMKRKTVGSNVLIGFLDRCHYMRFLDKCSMAYANAEALLQLPFL